MIQPQILSTELSKRTSFAATVLISPVIVSVGIILAVPQAQQLSYALNHQNPALYQFYTAAYVHANTGHLVSNLVGYAISVTPLYFLYTLQDRRREFFRAFAIILLVAPVVVTLTSYTVWTVLLDVDLLYDRGFSGVVAAFSGLLLMTVLETFDTELPEENATYAASIFGIALFATWAILFSGTIRLVMGGGLLVMLGVVAVASARDAISPAGLGDWARKNQQLATVLLFANFAALFLMVANFPASVEADGGFVNLVGHGAGFFIGMAVSRHFDPYSNS